MTNPISPNDHLPETEDVELVDDDPIESFNNRLPHVRPPTFRTTIAPEEWIALLPRGEKLTRWRNPTQQRVKLELTVRSPGIRGIGEQGPFIRQIDEQFVATDPDNPKSRTRIVETSMVPRVTCQVTIPPGGEVDLPRSADTAVVDIRDGKIVGGLAPQLRPIGRPFYASPAPALNPREIEAAKRAQLESQERNR